MDVTDSKNRWRVTYGYVENLTTGEIKPVSGINVNEVKYDNEETFVKKCAIAFETGMWPIASSKWQM